MSQLFNSLQNSQRPLPNNPMQIVQQIKSNPAQFLIDRGIRIPNGVDVSNPQAIINSLLQSGQVSNGRYRQVLQMMGRR